MRGAAEASAGPLISALKAQARLPAEEFDVRCLKDILNFALRCLGETFFFFFFTFTRIFLLYWSCLFSLQCQISFGEKISWLKKFSDPQLSVVGAVEWLSSSEGGSPGARLEVRGQLMSHGFCPLVSDLQNVISFMFSHWPCLL